ncbi:hypothetical protein PsYK624_054800 [Phanerochaete sordida]|uniref:Uncharacterized protein n=1 Tax=Phanerochaete sordida TaxID=48140 RepID=A0A9P3LBN3_9APHY|nr:hypothetical protein PsYK624_054800 [Phanerochaete sordida]
MLGGDQFSSRYRHYPGLPTPMTPQLPFLPGVPPPPYACYTRGGGIDALYDEIMSHMSPSGWMIQALMRIRAWEASQAAQEGDEVYGGVLGEEKLRARGRGTSDDTILVAEKLAGPGQPSAPTTGDWADQLKQETGIPAELLESPHGHFPAERHRVEQELDRYLHERDHDALSPEIADSQPQYQKLPSAVLHKNVTRRPTREHQERSSASCRNVGAARTDDDRGDRLSWQDPKYGAHVIRPRAYSPIRPIATEPAEQLSPSHPRETPRTSSRTFEEKAFVGWTAPKDLELERYQTEASTKKHREKTHDQDFDPNEALSTESAAPKTLDAASLRRFSGIQMAPLRLGLTGAAPYAKLATPEMPPVRPSFQGSVAARPSLPASPAARVRASQIPTVSTLFEAALTKAHLQHDGSTFTSSLEAESDVAPRRKRRRGGDDVHLAKRQRIVEWLEHGSG